MMIHKLQQELTSLIRLATPIIIAQLAGTAMGFVDTLMAGRVGAADLAAVALGSSIWIPLYLFISGVLLVTTARVAHASGAGQPERIGPLVRQALWLALLLGLLAAVALCSSRPLLLWMKVEEPLIEQTGLYLQGAAMGMPAVAIYQVLRCMSEGLGLTRPGMLFGLAGLLLNIPANFLFIHGLQLGGAGCGWATGCVMLFQCVAMLYWVYRRPQYRDCALFSRFELPERQQLTSLLGTGLPIGIGIFAEASIFCVIALLIGELGPVIVAGHQIALNISSMIFMLPYSLGMAVTVRCGQALGREQPAQARFAAITGIGLALSLACLSCLLLLWLRDSIAALYTADQAVIELAASLLVWAALFQLSDAIQVTSAGALRGYQDTRVTMLITLAAYWGVGLPLGYVLGLTDWLGEGSGPQGLWQGLVAGLTCAALLLAIRLQWRSRRA